MLQSVSSVRDLTAAIATGVRVKYAWVASRFDIVVAVAQWQGLNLLGFALMNARTQLGSPAIS